LAGIGLLAIATTMLTAALCAFTVLTYVVVYTPLKRRTWMCTIVGALPGAIPPLMGASALHGSLEGIGAIGWILFGILFLWQLPHFYAIAWMYKDDYARGGFPMLAVVDETGSRTAAHSIATLLLLAAVSLLPQALGITGNIYLGGAIGLNALFLLPALAFAWRRTRANARRTFFASLIYLPALLILLLVDRLPT